MAKRIDLEKAEFDASLQSLQGTRAVFSRLSAEVFAHLGMDVMQSEVRRTRDAMQGSLFSYGMREAVRRFFARVGANLEQSGQKVAEISRMMTAMYGKFSTEHGLALAEPMPFSLDKSHGSRHIALIHIPVIARVKRNSEHGKRVGNAFRRPPFPQPHDVRLFALDDAGQRIGVIGQLFQGEQAG